jgi:hypothetical protein
MLLHDLDVPDVVVHDGLLDLDQLGLLDDELLDDLLDLDDLGHLDVLCMTTWVMISGTLTIFSWMMGTSTRLSTIFSTSLMRGTTWLTIFSTSLMRSTG